MSDAVASPVPTNQPELEAVPSSWPGAFGVYKYSKEAVKFNLGAYLTALVVSIGAAIVLSILGSALNLPPMVNSLLQNLATLVLSLTGIIVLFAGLSRTKVTFGKALEETWPQLVSYLLLMILLGLIAVVTFVLLIIPFFIVMPRLALAPYFLVKQKLGVFDALQASWEQTRSNVGKAWGIIGVNIAIALLCLTIIGIPFAIYFYVMYSAAWNVLYAYVTDHAPAVAPTATPAATPVV